jgi:UDP-glucose 4-epimerase
LPVVVLRTSRFFPEGDDDGDRASSYADANLKLNEFLYRRVAIEDAVEAHILAAQKAPTLGFRRYVISATTPFGRGDLGAVAADAPAVLRHIVPGYEAEYALRGWRMLPALDRIYSNALARAELEWRPQDDFAAVLQRVSRGDAVLGPLAERVGVKGYHRSLLY